MASRAIQSLLASRHEWSRPHRIVVRVGAAAAWLAAAFYLAAAALTGDETWILESIGPVLAAGLMTVQILVGKEDGGLALFGSAVIVVIWSSAFGEHGTTVPAAVSLVLICSLGMLFVRRHRAMLALTLTVALGAVPFLWDLSSSEQVVLGAVMAVSFVMTHFILASIQTASSALSQRYQMLFEQSPAAVLEEDWSEAIAYVRSEYSGKSSRIRQFLLAYPTVVRRAVSKAKIVRANDAALELLDIRSITRFLGYRDPSIVTEDNLEDFVSALVNLYEGGKTWEREVSVTRRDGDLRWLLYRSVDTSTDTPATTIVSGLADITHMKLHHEAMAQVMKTKDEFIASVSHELRTPLTAVIGLTSELAESQGLSEEMRAEMLALVAAQAAEMSNIVDDLLVAARAEVGTIAVETQSVDLMRELESTLDGLGMTVDLPQEPPPPVLADPRRVRQILRNLLTNAQRYGGPDRRVTSGTLRDAAWIEVRDNGDGVPEEEANRIFEPSVTSGGRGSVGLGLAVARQLAELMGGSLQYERSAAETVFRLQLPLAGARQPVLASQNDKP
jgi:signal transduction histidine kinase